MEPTLPTIEFWTVMKWAAILMVISGLMKLASLLVSKWFYGSEKHNRRTDQEDTRGWMQQFFTLQKQYNESQIEMAKWMKGVNDHLADNGEAVRELAQSLVCHYPRERGRPQHSE